MTIPSGSTTLRARLRTVAVVFLAAMLVVVGLSALMLRSWSRADDDRTRVRSTAELVGSLRLAYSDQETGVRGYVLGRDEEFLAPYRSGRAREAASLEALRATDSGVGGFGEQLDLVEARAAAWRRIVAEPAIEAPSVSADETVGLAVFDELRSELDMLERMVAAELAELEVHLERVRRNALVVLIGSAVFAIGGTILVSSLFRRWIIRPLSAISDSALRLSNDSNAEMPSFHAAELNNVSDAITTLQSALELERDRAVTAYRGLEQSALLALQVRSELADEIGEMPDGWCAESMLVPAEGVVAGDCFDIGLLDAEHLYIVVIDVTGHGAAAALNALKAKSQLRAGLRSRATPGGALGILSRETFDDDEADLLTAFVAIINLTTGVCSYASAGHPPAMLRARGTVVELAPTGPLIGAFAASWTTEAVEMPHDATLLIHTDGTTETIGRDRERFGDARLRALVAAHADPNVLVAAVADAVSSYRAGPRTDDVTLLAIQRDACDDETSSLSNGVTSDTVPQ